MSDQNLPNGPKNAVPDRRLTSEFVAKWDMDLTTIDSLNKVATKNNCLLIIKGGLAVEAQTGGKQTRSHNDIDALFVNLPGLTENQVHEVVNEVIKSENTPWELYKRSPEKIEFREKEDKRDFFNRRRLELSIKNEADIQYESKKLIFSNEKEITVNVSEFYGLCAKKIRKLFMVNDKPEEAERETNLSDYTDLKRLIEMPGYEKGHVLKSLTKMIKKSEDPVKEASNEHDFIMGLLDQL